MTTLLAVALLALATFSGLTVYVVRAVLSYRISSRAPAVSDSAPIPRNEWRAEVETQMKSLTLAVAEGIERVTRAEKRIQKQVTGARRLVREAGLEHPGIEAEFAELESRDAEAGQELPPVPTPLEERRAVRIPGGHLEIGAA